MTVRLTTPSFKLAAEFVRLKDQSYLDRLRIAGSVHRQVMHLLSLFITTKSTMTLSQMNDLAEEEIRRLDCTPTFLGYRGFPASICMSVNEELVHGIPSDRTLKDGDLITFDFGCTFEGVIADAARTFQYGTPNPVHTKMIDAAEACLAAGIAAMQVDAHIGVIGEAIYRTARAGGCDVITQYGGHSLDYNQPHCQPFVANRALSTEGIRIQPGLTIAIEPLLVPWGSPTVTKTLADGWTVVTEQTSAHVEDTVFVREDGTIEVVT